MGSLDSIDTARAAPETGLNPCPPTAVASSSHHSPPSTPFHSSHPYERAMAAASGAAAAAAAAANAMSSIFGPCGDAGFPRIGIPSVPPIPPIPPLPSLPHMRFSRPRPHSRQTSSGRESVGGPTRECIMSGGYSMEVLVWPDGRMERIARSYDAESGRLHTSRPSSPTRGCSSVPLLPSAAAAGDAPDDACVLSTKSYQTIPESSDAASDDTDDTSSVATADDDPASVATSVRLKPCWSSSPSEDGEDGNGDGMSCGTSTRFPDLDVLKEILLGVFRSFRHTSCDESSTSLDETSAGDETPNEKLHDAFNFEYLQPSDDEERTVEMDDEVHTADVEMKETPEGDMESDEEDMAEESAEARMDVEVQSEAASEVLQTPQATHARRPWSVLRRMPMPPAHPPPPPPPPPPLPHHAPSQAHARVAAFATTASPPLPPGAVFFESGTYVADGANPEYVERVLSMRESAMRAAEQAANSACGCFSSFFGNYAFGSDRRA